MGPAHPTVRLAAVVLLGLAAGGLTAADRWAGLPLATAIERLRASGLDVVYSSELVPAELRVEREPSGGTPRELLEDLLAAHGLATREGPDGVLLVVPMAVQPTGEVRGVVTAAEGGHAIVGAEVSIVGREDLAFTDREGRFVVPTLEPGRYRLGVRRAGHLALELEVAVVSGEVTRLELSMPTLPSFLDEVVVTPSRYSLLHLAPEPRLFLDRASVERLPHIGDDVFRVVHRLPGANAGDLSAAFGLRGGHPEDVKVELDGLRLEQPYHLRDFQSLFSVVDVEAVDGVDVMTSAYPVEHGDSLGGIVEVASARPTGSRWAVGTSFLTARILGEGVWDQGQGSWAFSLRRGYLDVVFDWLETIGEDIPQNTSPNYADLFAAVRFPVSERTVAAVEMIATRDRVDIDDPDDGNLAHGRNTGWHLWTDLTTAWSERLSLRSLLSAVSSRRSFAGTFDHQNESWAEADDRRSYQVFGLAQDWRFTASERQLWKWGIEARWGSASYDYAARYVTLDPLVTGWWGPTEQRIDIETEPSGWQLGVYLADRVRLGQRLTAELGLRWDQQTWAPGDAQLSPRAHLVWSLGRAGTLRASWGRFAQAQGLHQLQVADGVDRFFPADRAVHRVLSWEVELGLRHELRVEGYFNTMSELRPRFENLIDPFDLFTPGQADRVQVDPDRGRAKGVEVVVRSAHPSALQWWAGYSLASVEDRVDGEWQPRPWDQRHALSFSVSRETASGWSLSLAGTVHSGWPTTPVTARWAWLPDGSFGVVTTVGPRNSLRFPAYRRLDLRISRTVPVGDGRLRCFLEVANLLNTDNVRSTSDVYFVRDGVRSLATVYERDSWIPLLPSFGIVWEF